MNEIISAALGVLGTIIVAIIGLYGARKAGIGYTQEKLVSGLKDLVESQDHKISLLEKDSVLKDTRIKALEEEVVELKRLTIRQARIITKLAASRGKAFDEDWELDEHD